MRTSPRSPWNTVPRSALTTPTSPGFLESRWLIQTAIHEVAGEEALGAVDLEPRHVHVAAGVGVQCPFRRADGVEQRKPRLARHDLVVPLEDELDRDGDLGGGFRQGVVAHQAEDGRLDPWLGRHQRYADRAAERHAPVPDRRTGADPVESGQRVDGGPPFGYREPRGDDATAGERVAEWLSRRAQLLDLRVERLILRRDGPAAPPWRVDGGDRVPAAGHVAAGPGRAPRGRPVPGASMPE